jgi:peptidoglycan/xylan/chitin deacetylase (PgdA/CDA1 family)
VKFHICWSMDCESCRAEVRDPALGRRAIAGFCEILEAAGWRGTLFLMPEEIEHMPELLHRAAQAGHEIALHLHPDASGYPSGHLGRYSYDQQAEILGTALAAFERVLGLRPRSVRPGFGSANDATFRAFADAGLRQCSASFPGRRMSNLAANWAGAPLFAHYANPHNRFLEDGLDLVELPISVDWETMIWGGVHPQDLRVEYTDARNHAFVIRKIMQRQVSDVLPLKALLPFTHNLFDYSSPLDFRRQTLEAMIADIRHCGSELGADLAGSTLAGAADDYRRARPYEQTGQGEHGTQSHHR